MMAQYRIEFIQGVGGGAKRVVEVEKGAWREGAGEGMGKGRERVGEKQESKRGGGSSPIYGGSGLPGCCQVNCGAEFRQNANRHLLLLPGPEPYIKSNHKPQKIASFLSSCVEGGYIGDPLILGIE